MADENNAGNAGGEDAGKDKAPEGGKGAESGGNGIKIEIDGKPAYVPEKFWDKSNGKLNTGALLTSYTELEKAGRPLLERINKAPKAETDYKIELPKDLGLPDGVEVKIEEDNPLLKTWRTLAHKAKLTNEEFNAGVVEYVKGELATKPDRKREATALGENGEARIDAVDQWMAKNLPKDLYQGMAKAAVNAVTIRAMEHLIKLAGGAEVKITPSSGTQSGGPVVTEIEYKEALSHRDYRKDPRKQEIVTRYLRQQKGKGR